MDKHKNHVLHIDSKNRTSGSHEDFVVHLNENDFHEAKYVQLKDISFPNTMYNITSSNNELNWVDGNTVEYSLLVPVGYYTADELASYINAETSTNATYTNSTIQFTNNRKTRTFTISNTATFHLLPTSTILDIIGFPNPSVVNVSIHTGTQPYNMLTTKYVHVLSSKLAEHDSMITSSNVKYPVIATIPVNAPFGYLISKSEEKTSADESRHNSNVNLSTIDIKLVDDDFKTIQLNGSGVIMTFTVRRH